MFLKTKLKIQYGKRLLLGVANRSGRLKPSVKTQSAYNGKGYIAGTGAGIVTVAGVAAVRRVFVMDRATMTVIRSCWSRPDGTYLLPYLDPKRHYLVFALDHLGQYEPVAYDWVLPHLD